MKDIIEQLVEDNVATQLVPNAASDIPVTCDFFPETIEAMQGKRFSGLPNVLRKNFSDLAGLATVIILDRNDAPAYLFGSSGTVTTTGLYGQSIRLLNALTLGSAFGDINPAGKAITVKASGSYVVSAKGKKAWVPACKFPPVGGNKAGSTPQKKPLSLATAALRVCAKPQTTAPRELACSVGIAVRDAAVGDDKQLPADIQRALVAVAATGINEDLPGCTPPLTFSNAVSLLDQALNAKTSDTAATIKSIVVSACPNVADVTKITTVLNRITAVAGAASGQPTATTLEATLALVADFAQAKAQSSKDPDLIAFATVVEDLATVGENAITVVQDIQSKDYGGAAGATFDALFDVMDSQCKAIQDIENTQTPATSASTASTTAVAPAVPAPVPAVALRAASHGPVKAESPEVCKGVNCDVPPKPAEADVSAGDVCTSNATKVIGTFLKSVTVYSIDSLTTPTPSASASADFRAAAIDLIEEAGGAGIRRHPVIGGVPGIVLPTFSLRGAARPGHIGTSTDNALMAYPSIDYLNLRVHNHRSTVYVGGVVSLVDALGPVTELATRSSGLGGDSHAGAVFALGFVVPRVELEIGVPQLTKNLVVGVGGAFRLFRADAAANAAANPSYCIIGQNGCSGSYLDNFEASVFVKYVP